MDLHLPLALVIFVSAIAFFIAGVIALANNGRDCTALAGVSIVSLIVFQVTTTFKPFGFVTIVIWPFVATHPLQIVAAFVAYLVIGIAVAVLRWMDFYSTARAAVDDAIAQVGPCASDVEKQVLDWEARVQSAIRTALSSTTGRAEKPQIINFKARFFGWASAWFIVGPWMILNNPMRRLCNFVYAKIGNTLQAMSDRAFRGIEIK